VGAVNSSRLVVFSTRKSRNPQSQRVHIEQTQRSGQLNRKPSELRHLAESGAAAMMQDDDEDEIARGNEQALSADQEERARMLAREVDGDMNKELFEIGQLLGRGGYGSVMLAKNLRSNELVAIKTFHNCGALVDKKALKEQRVWKGLHHPNVVEFKGSFVGDNGSLNLVVEYVDGLSLAEHLSQYSAFPETLVAEIARQVLCGLEYLHASGVTHRDLKPANILVDNNASVKICDFGVSSSENVQTINPGQQHMVGTPWYIAPEMVEYRPYTKSVDIWSLGCTIMELSTGKRPYHELSAMQVLFRMVEDQCPPIPHSLSYELKDFLKACFVWDPEKRPSATQLMHHPFIQKAIAL
jgi:serine/threonine protein kinase